jgi:signal transduction histidine kinase
VRCRKTLSFLITLFFSIPVFSQNGSANQLLDSLILKKGIEFKKELNFKKACSFFVKENYDSTLVFSAKQLNRKNNTTEINDFCHYFRGRSFVSKNLYDAAKSELKKVSSHSSLHYLVVLSIGEIALEQGRFHEALNNFEIIEKRGDLMLDFDKSTFYQNLGLCYFHANRFPDAEKYLLKGSNLLLKEKDTLKLIHSYINLGNLYYEQYKDQQAIPYFEKAYQLSKKVKNFELKQNSAVNMAVVEENRKNFVKALVYRKESEQWKDSLNDQNKVWAIAQLEKRYAVNQKQKEIRLLEAENKIKKAERNGLFYSSLSLLILLGTSLYFYKQKVKRNAVILQQKIELDELNATKDKLFSIVSHDLRSSVNALKTSTSKLITNLESKNYTELDVLLHRNSSIANSAYNLLDNLLNWALLQTKQMYFQQESQHLYSIVQQIEFNYKPLFLDKSIRFENTIAKDIFVFVDLDSLKIILRNLLDNAIKFSEATDTISIYTRDSNDEFCNLIIEDTGLGMDIQTQNELLKDTTLLSKKGNNEAIGSGLGIQLCKSMIKKNGGKLAIESQKDIGTKFIVSLLKIQNHG